MDSSEPDLDRLLELARHLSPLEKLRLIEELAPDLEESLRDVAAGSSERARRSLRGLLQGCDIGADEIDQARREMWGGFPREAM